MLVLRHPCSTSQLLVHFVGLLHVVGLLYSRQVMAEDYELLLNKLLNSLRRCQDYVSKTFAHTDLSGLEMVVDG